MLCDDAIASLHRSIKAEHPDHDEIKRAQNAHYAERMINALERAERFVLSPLTVETAAQLSDPKTVERTRDHIFTPARLTWLEWSGQTPGGYDAGHRHGLLLIGSDEAIVHVGWGAYFLDTSTPAWRRRISPFPLTWDFPSPSRPILEWIYSPAEAIMRGSLGTSDIDFGALGRVSSRKLGSFLGAALALINTPRLSYVVDHDNAILNRLRGQRRALPLLQYKEVRIAIDRGELGLGHQLPSTEGRPLHHVRTFLRLKRGKVELVRPHWRGNPRFGVIRHRYVAFRAEDESGPWKGGPLPAPSIIGQLIEESGDA